MNYYALQLLDKSNLPQAGANQTTLNQILSDFFVVLGAIAFLMFVIAGLRYVFARGQPEAVTKAKNTIQYSIIGLVIAALAYSIVNFVLQKAG